ncbi:MAG: class I SAM-dependent methyltransferase [Rhodospirillaceae bacterium]|nr:class I SAM-dependent methyltransferase [Rhodospirillaceae bacterium]MCK5547168.1 class I SAM-dependent methyltransferase [Rhodospirillaceae bacterium]
MGTSELTIQPPSDIGDLLEFIGQVYDHRLKECGPTAQGVFWKHEEGQTLRHEILLQIVEPSDLCGNITINDLGCGYGAFFEILKNNPLMSESKYFGYDISMEMIDAARIRNHDNRANFIHSARASETADYSFASGTFNMSLGAIDHLWSDYVYSSIRMLWENTKKGLAFNMLDSNSGAKLTDLHYANMDDTIKYAKTLTPNVEIITDYPLDEWTVFMRR